MLKTKFAILFCFTLIVQSSIAQLRLAKIFSSNMVLQCDTSVPIWGWSSAGEMVTVYFNNNEYKVRGNKDGVWKVFLPSTPHGGPYDFKIESKNQELILTNVLFGDVWLCGGQSNMEWFVENSMNAEDEISNANHGNIRLFDVPRRISTLPQNDFETGNWTTCNPETIAQFSAVGYYFGRDLQEKIKKPIGLISNNYGGTVVEAWTSSDGLSDLPVYQKQIQELNAIEDLEAEKSKGESEGAKWLAKFKSMDKGVNGDEFLWSKPQQKIDDWEEMSLPATWESAGVDELEELDGVIWFVKEFEISKENAGKTAKLSLGPIDDSDKTWINGKLVGDTYNRFNKDRNYEIPTMVLQEGKNRIVIRVEDYVGGGGLYGEREKLFLEIEKNRISLAGAWNYRVGMIPKHPMSTEVFGPNTYPTCLFNGMIAPMVDFPIKGVIWYQGETNTYRAVEYQDLFQRWIKDWRQQFNNKTLPILFVQLANFKSEDEEPTESIWAELREAQSMALELPNTAMISAIDIGETKSIHPVNKQEVGRRLSLAAQNEVYSFPKIKYQGASFSHFKKEGKYIDLFFKNTYEGLMVTDKFFYVFGFSIAGVDQKFHWAKAEIIAPNHIRVWSDKIENPQAVRYSWQDNPLPANVFNSEKFPLLPFRTDNWKLSTLGIVRQ